MARAQESLQHVGTGGSLLLQVRGVSFAYPTRDGPVHALSGISIDVKEGDLVSVVGPSGCGKTTLLHLIAGFLFPTEGAILLDDRPVAGPDAGRGVVFQQPTLYPWLNVEDNIAFGLKMRGAPADTRRAVIDRYLGLMGLSDFRRRAPYELSGGMQQRAAIARVLANDPRMMLMDEPFGALDALTREHMQVELLKLWRDTRKTIFFITHSVEEAIFLATRVLVMSPRPGRILADLDVRFSRKHEAAESRAVKALPEFVRLREQVLAYIWQEA